MTENRDFVENNYPLKESNGFEYGVSFWGDENVLELDRGGGCTTL